MNEGRSDDLEKVREEHSLDRREESLIRQVAILRAKVDPDIETIRLIEDLESELREIAARRGTGGSNLT